MQKLFSLEGGVYHTLSLIKNLIVLNLLMIMTSLPIITIGASLSATFYVSSKLVNGEEIRLFETYVKIFKNKFKISLIIFMINGLLGFSLIMLIKAIGIELLSFPLLVLFASFLLINEAIYPLLSLNKGSIKLLYKESIGLTLQYLVYFVACFIITIIWGLFPIYFIKLSFIWLALGGSLSVYLKAKLLNRIFIKSNYIIEWKEEVR